MLGTVQYSTIEGGVVEDKDLKSGFKRMLGDKHVLNQRIQRSNDYEEQQCNTME